MKFYIHDIFNVFQCNGSKDTFLKIFYCPHTKKLGVELIARKVMDHEDNWYVLFETYNFDWKVFSFNFFSGNNL